MEFKTKHFKVNVKLFIKLITSGSLFEVFLKQKRVIVKKNVFKTERKLNVHWMVV